MTEKHYSYASDVWSLGCVFYEILTLNFERTMYIESITSDDFTSEIRDEIQSLGYSAELANLVSKTLQKPDMRITLPEIIQHLNNF